MKLWDEVRKDYADAIRSASAMADAYRATGDHARYMGMRSKAEQVTSRLAYLENLRDQEFAYAERLRALYALQHERA